MAQTQLSPPDLPPWRGLPTQEEMDRLAARARAAYQRNREEIEAKYPAGTLILIDGDDETGRTYTPGTDMLIIEQEHYRQYPGAYDSSCFFRVGEV